MNKTILIIDDDEALRGSLARGLRQNNFNAVTADSAESGAAVLARITPDAIVLDRMMGGADGLTALSAWRAAGLDVPVIMLTAMSGTENSIAGLSGGADDYLAKPFQLRELVLRLNNIMQRRPPAAIPALPDGLAYTDGEFFISHLKAPAADQSSFAKATADRRPTTNDQRLLSLSVAEKNFLLELTNPVGNIVPGAPMIAKRLRAKLNAALPDTDIVTVRGKGYKLVNS